VQDARWLFFDLGNTLVSEEAAIECRIQRLVDALARHGRHYSADEVRSAFEEASAEFLPRLVVSAIEKLVDDPTCRRAVAAESPYPKELEAPYEGADKVLRTLSSGYKIGVIANQSAGSADRLTKWGLMPFISICLCSAELGLEKPDPAIFELALARARCDASQAVMIGDRLDNDIRPARMLGWRTIRVLQGFARFQSPRDAWDEPDGIVPKVKRLLPIFGA
jgi:8-oxo-dGTP diphosphatase/putative hydrolase of the HAD superfamily